MIFNAVVKLHDQAYAIKLGDLVRKLITGRNNEQKVWGLFHSPAFIFFALLYPIMKVQLMSPHFYCFHKCLCGSSVQSCLLY